MTYIEKLFLRKRTFEIKSNGVEVHDTGIFRSTLRFYKFESIGIHQNFEKGNILISVAFIILITFLTYFLATIFTSLSNVLIVIYLLAIFSYLLIIVQSSSYKGTLYFSDENRSLGKELYLQTNYPLNSEA